MENMGNFQHKKSPKIRTIINLLVTLTGFEPMNAAVKGQCVKPLHQRAKKWWAWGDLNLRPHAYQACALTS